MKTAKKTISILLAIALAVGGIFSSATDASAAGKSLEKLKIKWDLKNGKSYKVPIRLAFVEKEGKGTIQIKNLKKTNAKKKGYKKVTFTFEYYGENINVPEDDIVRMCEVGLWELNNRYFTVVDYASGTSLETKNKYNVTVKNSAWKTTYFPKQHAQHYQGEKLDIDWWFRCTKKSTTKVTITYPKSYKNLCIGIGENIGEQRPDAMAILKENKNDKAFWKGKASFDKTNMYKKWKKYAHFMRIK